MPCINYNDTVFRSLFPSFSNQQTYPMAVIQLWWNNATSYLSNQYNGCRWGALTLAQQTIALNYMTAHLLYLNNLAVTGEQSGIVTGASIDKVSVQIEPPPQTNQWQWWLNQSPYGQQLLALLQVATVGGRFINPQPTITAFRT